MYSSVWNAKYLTEYENKNICSTPAGFRNNLLMTTSEKLIIAISDKYFLIQMESLVRDWSKYSTILIEC